ncbi:hypothetical protein [Photobacterium damselae]|uniref:Uncharacterized protein n=1 Tax=Photobacterium damselae subsp. damselae TaxID=85581 RepID=A0AAD3WTY5_PHODD|nr:hypothetical protein [Photobacterium damselae]KAB1178905.1 hypothetical protein F6450_14510 [Photobacterium damselae subsp. damselae]
MDILLNAKMLSKPCTSHALCLDIKLDSISKELDKLYQGKNLSESDFNSYMALQNEIESYKYLSEKERNVAFLGFYDRVKIIFDILINNH